MQTRRRLLNLLRFLAPSLCGFALLAASAVDPPKPLEVKVTRPTRGEIIRYVTLPGTIRANQQATLYAKVPGYLKSIAVDKGDKVRAGQALGEIEVPELVAERARYRAELARAQAEVRVAELESARLGKARTQSPDLIVPQAVDAAEGRLAMAQAGIESAKANLERTEMLLAFSRLTAPFSGVVTMRHVDPGAFIPAATGGSPASAAVLTLMDF
ncbi:MAG TPA: efflux RND transporter periplasmic adaptor subunit, partial [Candidatus Dormibacteraeota bacterium]|nr:efflux RND transporter periplasmic adaptor subunit [Candidatus Dormibacteraeota bacterium]